MLLTTVKRLICKSLTVTVDHETDLPKLREDMAFISGNCGFIIVPYISLSNHWNFLTYFRGYSVSGKK